jgi:hypothetical protein
MRLKGSDESIVGQTAGCFELIINSSASNEMSAKTDAFGTTIVIDGNRLVYIKLLTIIVYFSAVNLTANAPGADRIWYDQSCRFRVEASIAMIDSNCVVLERTKGRRKIEIAIDRLSESDQAYVEAVLELRSAGRS